MEIKTYQELASLTREELDAFTPEELETLKTSIADNEAQSAEARKKETEDFAKAKELAENYKIRAEKAEKAAKGGGEPPKEPQGLSNKDVLYLAKADIHEDDLDEVLDWAKFKGVDVREAHKQMKPRLDLKTEERKSAQVTQIKGARGATAPTAEDLISKASKGQLPETDEDIQALADAEMARKVALSKR